MKNSCCVSCQSIYRKNLFIGAERPPCRTAEPNRLAIQAMSIGRKNRAANGTGSRQRLGLLPLRAASSAGSS